LVAVFGVRSTSSYLRACRQGFPGLSGLQS
jgi:hypothetical protein